MLTKYSHNFHLVVLSPLPILISFSIYNFLLSIVCYLNKIIYSEYYILGSFILTIIILLNWMNEIIIEGTYIGLHTKIVQTMLNKGFILFVLSEVLIFASLFFAYFYNSLIPSIFIGNNYPYNGIILLNIYSNPLLNTLLLYYSGLSCTISLNYLKNRNKWNSILYLIITIILSCTFTTIQYIEYNNAKFTLLDGIYSTNFYIITGMHGLHVIIGTLLLLGSLIRLYKNHFTNNHYIGYTSSTIYWAFVDYVWLIVFATIYVWNSY